MKQTSINLQAASNVLCIDGSSAAGINHYGNWYFWKTAIFAYRLIIIGKTSFKLNTDTSLQKELVFVKKK